ncbi:MAG: hypothetical protein ACI8ZM_001533 [Crocinitomix sp.]|jgi:hypothetical protein
MRIICIIGAIVTLLYVFLNYILNIHFNLFSAEQNTILFIINLVLLFTHIIIFAVYAYRRKFTILFVFWILNYLIFIWYQYKIMTFNWEHQFYQNEMDELTFYSKIADSAMVFMAISILVSRPRKRIPLVIFALVSILTVLLVTKNWMPIEGYNYLLLINIFSPLLIAINYIFELKNYKAGSVRLNSKRTDVIDLE